VCSVSPYPSATHPHRADFQVLAARFAHTQAGPLCLSRRGTPTTPCPATATTTTTTAEEPTATGSGGTPHTPRDPDVVAVAPSSPGAASNCDAQPAFTKPRCAGARSDAAPSTRRVQVVVVKGQQAGQPGGGASTTNTDAPGATDGSWRCAVCTLDNAPTASACAACAASRVLDAPHTPSRSRDPCLAPSQASSADVALSDNKQRTCGCVDVWMCVDVCACGSGRSLLVVSRVTLPRGAPPQEHPLPWSHVAGAHSSSNPPPSRVPCVPCVGTLRRGSTRPRGPAPCARC